MPGESKSSPREIQNYLVRISGPLLDRIDMHIKVPQVKFREMSNVQPGETSAQVRERLVAARKIQHTRFAGQTKVNCNARMGTFDYYTANNTHRKPQKNQALLSCQAISARN